MYEQTLTQAGLSEDQARVYETLLKHGNSPASKISTYTGLKRGLTYKVLDELEKAGLIIKHEKEGSVAQFEPAHPLKLKDLADKKTREAADAHVALDGIISPLISDFNLVSGRPGVLVYEGLDGIKKVLNDTLTSKTEICSYGDIEAIVKNFGDINKAYGIKREKLGIKRRGLLLDTLFAREYLKDYHSAVTENRFIRTEAVPFKSIMNIYDEKIAYITLQPEKIICAIIANKDIYEMHQCLFEYLWNITEQIKPLHE